MITKGKILIVYFYDSSLGIPMPKHSTIWTAQSASISLLSSLYEQWGENTSEIKCMYSNILTISICNNRADFLVPRHNLRSLQLLWVENS